MKNKLALMITLLITAIALIAIIIILAITAKKKSETEQLSEELLEQYEYNKNPSIKSAEEYKDDLAFAPYGGDVTEDDTVGLPDDYTDPDSELNKLTTTKPIDLVRVTNGNIPMSEWSAIEQQALDHLHRLYPEADNVICELTYIDGTQTQMFKVTYNNYNTNTMCLYDTDKHTCTFTEY